MVRKIKTKSKKKSINCTYTKCNGCCWCKSKFTDNGIEFLCHKTMTKIDTSTLQDEKSCFADTLSMEEYEKFLEMNMVDLDKLDTELID